MSREQLSRNMLIQLLSQYLLGQQGDDDDDDDYENPSEDADDEEEVEEEPQGSTYEPLYHSPIHVEQLCFTAASSDKSNTSVHKMVRQREISHQNMFSKPKLEGKGPWPSRTAPSFSSRARRHISSRMVPNKMKPLANYGEHVFCGMFSQDGSLYLSACQDSVIRLYNTETWKEVKQIIARDIGWSIISTDYSPNQQWVIYSSWSNYVHLCNTSGDHEVHEALDMKPPQQRFCLFSSQFSPDSREIVGGSSDAALYFYDLDRRVRSARVEAHDDDVNAVCFLDKSSQTLCSGSDDSLVKIWDRRALDDGPVGIFAGHVEGITFIDSKMDGHYIISNGKDQAIKLWDLRKMDNKMPKKIRRPVNQWHDYRRFMPRHFPKHPEDKSVMEYRGHKVLQTLIRCRFSPVETTGQRYIYTGSHDGTVVVYDVLTGEVVKQLAGHRALVRDVHWHPHQPMLLSASWDGTVKIWSYDAEKDFLQTAAVANNNNANTNASVEEDDDDEDLDEMQD
jgi:WD repeat-containing protein 23